ncbi:hypothetical protein EUTSA_v10023472mg [Eutrema salsugineum]|uniref:Mitochondrial transcription termination factor family protein n=1 Tax=Eutrema salsugineum TaxID=72664 RepID=V4KPD4_EUTSA|nr:uncharacterized protein LOC18010247 [Eutrema salsugineum]ESQ29223.1 hypothetical protein EUTSA_v10023472mg [Eutrema salsugineum]
MYSSILYGRRSLVLQKWPNLRGSVQNVFSAFSSSFFSSSAADVSAPQDGRKGSNFTVSYLVESLGFTTKLAESISRKVWSEGKGDPDSVLSLLRSHGFTGPQISSIIRAFPGLLILDAEKSIGPKLQFLQSRGASSSELTEILSKVPKILALRWEKAICKHYDFVKNIINADQSSKGYEKSCQSSMPQANKLRNVLVLKELGVPQKLLFSMLISDTHVCCGKERFEESVKKVVDMGIDPTTLKFVDALHAVYQMSDKTIEEKVNVYKSFGFDVEDVWAMFKKWPKFLIYSEQKIVDSIETLLGLGFTRDEFVMMCKRFPQLLGCSSETLLKKTEFVVKKMNWPLKAVASTPAVLGYSMEKRIVPRCNVIKALMSKGLLGKGSELPSMSYVLAITDQAFLNKYVKKHDDKELVSELMAILTRGRVS